MDSGTDKYPVLYYFIDLKRGMGYIEAVRDLGYSSKRMRVVPVVTRADIYSMRENGDDRSWLEDYVHGDHGEEKVRIVQAGSSTPEYLSTNVYCIGILETLSAYQVDSLNQFDELWVPKADMMDWYEERGVKTNKFEVMPPGDVARFFDPMSLA